MQLAIHLVIAVVTCAALTPRCDAKANNFPAGQCTYYAAEKFNQRAPEPGVNWGGNACRWLQNAADSGWETHTNPLSAAPGAIAVWADGWEGLGHVAYVLEVSKDRRQIRIGEANWGPDEIKTLSLPDGLRRKSRTGVPYRFVGYIYPKYYGKVCVPPRP